MWTFSEASCKFFLLPMEMGHWWSFQLWQSIVFLRAKRWQKGSGKVVSIPSLPLESCCDVIIQMISQLCPSLSISYPFLSWHLAWLDKDSQNWITVQTLKLKLVSLVFLWGSTASSLTSWIKLNSNDFLPELNLIQMTPYRRVRLMEELIILFEILIAIFYFQEHLGSRFHLFSRLRLRLGDYWLDSKMQDMGVQGWWLKWIRKSFELPFWIAA